MKALLNMQWNHDLTSYVGFVDLVKAYDTANCDLLLRILERYSAPQNLLWQFERHTPTMSAYSKLRRK
jgi:hypothetical protein